MHIQFLVGFYTSRPDLKGLVRRESARLRAATFDLTLARYADVKPASLDFVNETGELDVAVKAVSIVQHHDGVSL